MEVNFVSTTQLQKNPTKVIDKEPIQVLLTNNKLSGMLLSANLTKHLLDSEIFQQIREEFWELNDKETKDVIKKCRSGKKPDMSLKDFRQEYGV